MRVEIHLAAPMYRELVDAATDATIAEEPTDQPPADNDRPRSCEDAVQQFARECIEVVLADRRRARALLRRRGDFLVAQ